ncbi:MAG TPA: hypothetical protein VHU84_03545, partial [Lacipirellulaceae bacterium]|nr:hypothetical protein [Lacipirellulaceae bacterium]
MLTCGRYSLRALILTTTLLAIVFALVGYQRNAVNRQTFALTEIARLGGVPNLIDYREGMAFTVCASQQPRFTFLNYIFGKDYYIYAPQINLTAASLTSDKVRSM